MINHFFFLFLLFLIEYLYILQTSQYYDNDELHVN